MANEWYNVQPRFGNLESEVNYDQPNQTDDTRIEMPKESSKGKNFFQKYKIYIIILGFIIILFIITIAIFHMQKKSKDTFPLEENKTKEKIDLDEMKKLRDLRRQTKKQENFNEIGETFIIIEPNVTEKNKRNDVIQSSDKIVEIDDDEEEKIIQSQAEKNKLMEQQRQLEYQQKQLEQQQKQLEYQHQQMETQKQIEKQRLLDQYKQLEQLRYQDQQKQIEQENYRRMLELQKRRELEQQQYLQRQSMMQQNKLEDVAQMPQFQQQVIKPESHHSNPITSINPTNEVIQDKQSDNITLDKQNISDALDSLIEKIP